MTIPGALLLAFGLFWTQLPDAPVRSLPDPGVVTTGQATTPAGVPAIFRGRVYGVSFGASSDELLVSTNGAFYRLDWRKNEVLQKLDWGKGTPGLQSIAFDPKSEQALTVVEMDAKSGQAPPVGLFALSNGSSRSVISNLGLYNSGAMTIAAKARIAAIPLIHDNQLAIVDLDSNTLVRKVGTSIAPFGAAVNTATDPKAQEQKDREKKYGQFDAIDQDYRMTHLHVIEVDSKKTRRLTHGSFTVGAFDWSPDGKEIAFDHRINPALTNNDTADISVVNVESGAVRLLVSQAGPDTNPIWSPDGSKIAFESAMGNPDFFYTNRAIGIVASSGGPGTAITNATVEFDEDPSIVSWKTAGLFFTASQRTNSYLFRLEPASLRIAKIAPANGWIGSNFSLNAAGDRAAYVASNAKTFPEIYVANFRSPDQKKLTDTGAQTADWEPTSREVITWKSQDGTAIEGVLHKPAGFQAGKRYPLLVVIHGGPTGISRPAPFSSTTIYPIDVWLGKGVLVLEPNYRGSAGYGEKFRSLNVRNLGVGDAWDVLSGIDSLIAQGLVDRDRVGCMGWSQGGYISAFLTTHDSARFKAISVGAGISDWMTYYVSTDIHPFTRQYLKATPWEDPAIYAKTSPITYIKGAKTPTLIQHGATDQRVPLPNAFELYQGLQDQHPTKLFIYKGFEGVGHGPSKPKSSRAVMEHNLGWFDQYFFKE
jgi:dipeptidyl aminopeptidase/acylaminoacyl peptidase